ncbi:MAG TPA: hypothetical protein VGL34_03775 [Steroidobacteraceae bacterium]|jgi:hypothetical protein
MKSSAAAISLGAVLLGFASSSGVSAAAVEQPPMPSAYSAPALYDLGNFYARIGEPAMAVLNYERARVFAPTDPDIQANLRHVRESVGLPAQTGGWRGWLRQHDRWANPNTVYWIGLFGLVLAGISLLWRRKAEFRAVLGTGAAIGVACVALAIGDAVATAPTLQESVVMFATPACASPVSGAEPLFTVPLADVVSVRDEHGGFDLIIDSQDREGWVPTGSLKPVIPRSEAIHGFRQIIHRLIR